MSKLLNLDRDLLFNLYIKQRKTTPRIARIINYSQSTIWKYLRKYNIPTRSSSETKSLNLDKNLLYDLYIKQKKHSIEIGRLLKCHSLTVRNYLHKYNIPVRSHSECRKGNLSGTWKGGRTHTSKGYILIHKPNHPNIIRGHYVYEHRLVMEKKIGRYLEFWEVVHHINGIKDDNRPKNLELCPNRATNTALDNLLKENKRLKTRIKELEENYNVPRTIPRDKGRIFTIS